MAKNYFVAGTDTGVGKTQITTGLIALAKAQGLTAYGLKPIAAGCEQTDVGWVNEDALQIQQVNAVAIEYAQINPVALKAPLAPHIAAAQEGRQLTLSLIEESVREALTYPADLRLIEGAGGWRIPLSATEQLADLPKRLNTPVILVVAMRLGCLNHALLTAQAIAADGLALAGWVANSTGGPMDELEENINTLRQYLPVPCLGCVPYLSDLTPNNVASYLTLPALV